VAAGLVLCRCLPARLSNGAGRDSAGSQHAHGAREDFRRVWELRSVHRFAEFFGLVELRPDPEPPTTVSPYLESWQVRKAPVLGQVVQWKVLPPDD
jgi:hypothetical protein